MRKLIIGIIIGAVLGNVYTAFAKWESTSRDAASVVMYGYNGSDIVSVKVDSNGYLVL